MGGDDSEADKLLMVASPVMLAMLRDAETFISGFEYDNSQQGIDGPEGLLARIRDVIASATGKEA
ncbi:MAG: hypothetical protein DI547_05090 [Sphingobium sp.]|nr:MAG: hypothetical protein DI547_05090 [Sphingobium sp.]